MGTTRFTLVEKVWNFYFQAFYASESPYGWQSNRFGCFLGVAAFSGLCAGDGASIDMDLYPLSP